MYFLPLKLVLAHFEVGTHKPFLKFLVRLECYKIRHLLVLEIESSFYLTLNNNEYHRNSVNIRRRSAKRYVAHCRVSSRSHSNKLFPG